MLHRVYLRLPHPLTPGKTYTVTLAHINVQKPTIDARVRPGARSQRIGPRQSGRISPRRPGQAGVGFALDGRRRRVRYVSRALSVPRGRCRHQSDGLFGACAGMPGPPTSPKYDAHDAQLQRRPPVYPLDFSAFAPAGRYRVVVDGVGCSYDFEIGRDSVGAAPFQTCR